MVDSDETDEEFEEEKKRKKTKPGKAPLKKPNKTQATENSAAKIKRGNNPPSEVVKQSRVLEKNSISSGGQHKADPASPLRPLGIHNPSSPSRPSALSSPAATTPTSSLNLKDLLKLKSGGIGSKSTPSTPNQHRGSPAPAWKPPAKVGSSLANSSSLPASPGLSPGLRRLGLSRNFRSPAPLHKNLKLSQ